MWWKELFYAGGVVRTGLDLPDIKGKFYPSAFSALSFKGLRGRLFYISDYFAFETSDF